MRSKLNFSFVEALKPQEKRFDVYDTQQHGLCLRVEPSGRKTWSVVFKWEGRMERYTIGLYPDVTLADARTKAGDVIAGVKKKKNPNHEKRAELEAAEAARLAALTALAEQLNADTFSALRDVYLEKYASKKRSGRETGRILKLYFKKLDTLKAKDVTRAQIRAILDDLEETAPVMANRALAAIRGMYNWAIRKDRLEVNPAHRIPAPTEERERDRVLNPDEIKKIWQTCDAHRSAVANSYQLRLLTTQRGVEVLSMRWDEIDPETHWWTIQRDVAKNEKATRVYLSDAAWRLIERAKARNEKRTKRQGGPSPWVFPGRRHGRPVIEPKKVMKEIFEAAGIENWKGHDLRRTGSTIMAECGVPGNIISKCLNHTEESGRDSGSKITRIYNRYEYDSEKQKAWIALGNRITFLVSDLHVVKAN